MDTQALFNTISEFHLPLLFLLNSGIGFPILVANSPITLSFTKSSRSILGLLVPERRPNIGDEGIIFADLKK
jgi:hypothetical protein